MPAPTYARFKPKGYPATDYRWIQIEGAGVKQASIPLHLRIIEERGTQGLTTTAIATDLLRTGTHFSVEEAPELGRRIALTGERGVFLPASRIFTVH